MYRSALILAAAAFVASDVRAQTTSADHTFARAGNPQSIAPWARPSQTPSKSLEYVGRAYVLRTDCMPRQAEGVIGYDCSSTLRGLEMWIAPPGPYRTDGPRVFDVFSIRPVRRALASKEAESHDTSGYATVGAPR